MSLEPKQRLRRRDGGGWMSSGRARVGWGFSVQSLVRRRANGADARAKKSPTLLPGSLGFDGYMAELPVPTVPNADLKPCVMPL